MKLIAKILATMIAKLLGAALVFLGTASFLVLKDVYYNHLTLIVFGLACLGVGSYMLLRKF